MKIIIFLIFNIFSTVVFPKDVIHSECSLFTRDGALLKTVSGGGYCVFLADGSHVQATISKIEYVNNKDEVVWSHQDSFHHQIKVNAENNKVYALGDVVSSVLNVPVRFDAIKVYDLKKGTLLKNVSMEPFIKELVDWSEPQSIISKHNSSRNTPLRIGDTTHVNSIYEIPENKLSGKDSAFSKGNWLVNVPFYGKFVIFNKDLTKILYQKKLVPFDEVIHDVQLLENGDILFFENYFQLPKEKITVSAIRKYSLIKNEYVYTYPLYDKQNAYFVYLRGGVQEISPEHFLVSAGDEKNGYGVVEVKKNEMGPLIPLFKMSANGIGESFQDAKVILDIKYFDNYLGGP